jgi:hypothetical protein
MVAKSYPGYFVVFYQALPLTLPTHRHTSLHAETKTPTSSWLLGRLRSFHGRQR